MSANPAGLKLRPAGFAAEPDSLPGTISAVTVEVCLSRYLDRIRAIVLTGSLARGEGTFVRQDSTWLVAGDAEFILILHDSQSLPARDDEEDLQLAIEERLLERGV